MDGSLFSQCPGHMLTHSGRAQGEDRAPAKPQWGECQGSRGLRPQRDPPLRDEISLSRSPDASASSPPLQPGPEGCTPAPGCPPGRLPRKALGPPELGAGGNVGPSVWGLGLGHSHRRAEPTEDSCTRPHCGAWMRPLRSQRPPFTRLVLVRGPHGRELLATQGFRAGDTLLGHRWPSLLGAGRARRLHRQTSPGEHAGSEQGASLPFQHQAGPGPWAGCLLHRPVPVLSGWKVLVGLSKREAGYLACIFTAL